MSGSFCFCFFCVFVCNFHGPSTLSFFICFCFLFSCFPCLSISFHFFSFFFSFFHFFSFPFIFYHEKTFHFVLFFSRKNITKPDLLQFNTLFSFAEEDMVLNMLLRSAKHSARYDAKYGHIIMPYCLIWCHAFWPH